MISMPNHVRTKLLIKNGHLHNHDIIHRRTAVGVPAFVAAIVVTTVVVATAIFAAAPFSTTVTKTVPEITTTTATTTSTLTVTSTSLATLLPATETTTVTVTPTNSTTLTTTTSIECTISGQPGPFYLRVASDSNQTPIAGAHVAATNEPACPTSPTTLTFITNNTEWYSLNSQDN